MGTIVRTLCAWCPDWPVAALRRADPRLHDVSLVVLERGRVRAASPEARARGVARGLRRREAEARCPGVVVVDADLSAEARAFEEVLRALDDVTPRVAVERPGLCSFPVGGPARYFGGDEPVAERVRAAARAVGVEARVGVAGSGFAAVLAARSSAATTVVPPGETAAFLAGQPVGVLAERGLDGIAGLLVRLGVRTLGDLAALPEATVVARFGPEGAVAHRLARGLDERPLAAREPPPELAEVVELDPPADRVDVVAFAAKAAADRLLARLERWGLACTRVAVEAETEHGERLSRVWALSDAITFSAAVLTQRVRWQLDAWLPVLEQVLLEYRGELAPESRGSGGLVRLRLVPDEVVPARGRQLGFFGSDPHAADRAGRVLARLQGMLGYDAVVTPALCGGRTPAERVRWVPWGEPPPPVLEQVLLDIRGELAPESRGWPGAVPAPAPAVVFEPPRPAELLDAGGRPVAVSGRGEPSAAPSRLACAVLPGEGGAVEAWAGPWVHDLRWWDPLRRRRRALWQVVAAGVACLVVTERSRAWVEAVYD